MSSRTTLAALALVSVAACATEPAPASEHHSQAIIGGTSAAAGQFPTVVAIYDAGDKTICTGTLVTPTAVLTAAHCVADGGDETERKRLLDDTSIYLDTLSMYEPLAKLAIDDIVVHPGYVRLADDPESNGFHDVAVIRLKTPVTDRRVARIARASLGVSLGQPFTLVGYGIYEANTGKAGRLYSVEDASVDCAPHGAPNDRFICFDRTDGSGACSGDSGSPLFRATSSGVRELVGVHAWGSGGAICGGIGADSKIDGEVDFLQTTLGDAFVCAADGVCEASCGEADIDCAALPDAACKADNDCGEYYGCDAGVCRELADMPLLNPTNTVDKIHGGGCNAATDNIGGGLFLLIASGYLAMMRRRR